MNWQQNDLMKIYGIYNRIYKLKVSGIVYLSSFLLSQKEIQNPNIYPYNVFRNKTENHIYFQPITVFYGNNASGKSTLLNIMANKLDLQGKEYATCNKYGLPYFSDFINECSYELGENDYGKKLKRIPNDSRYIKSEDVLYEIKKIQQEGVLAEGYVYEHVRRGMPFFQTEMSKQMEYMKFAQEKYSNGETTLQLLDDYLEMDALYLLDEPEVSLSPINQVYLAKKINEMARLLNCQFVISTHSPFMLGTLNAKIYNLDSKDFEIVKWTELENVKYFFDFFEKHRNDFC